MARIKWNTNGIGFKRGSTKDIIFRFDNSLHWLKFDFVTTESSCKSMVREMAIRYGAKSIEMKYSYIDGKKTESDIIKVNTFDSKSGSTEYRFSRDIFQNRRFLRSQELTYDDVFADGSEVFEKS